MSEAIPVDPKDAVDPGPSTTPGTKRERGSASQAKLVWRAFRKHKLAVGGGVVVLLLFLVALLAEFVAPYSPTGHVNSDYTYGPPQRLHVIDTTDGVHIGPYVYGHTFEQDEESLAIEYTVDESNKIPVGFFVKGAEYELFGVIPWDRHLIGPTEPGEPMYLLGTDRIGRDQFSRLAHATRVSISVALVAALLAFLLGVTLGSISGYLGGRVDTFIQRIIEFIMSIPALPLWAALTAAIPVSIGAVTRYFYISLILAVLAWTTLAREIRGRFLALREEDFVTSAWLDGSSRRRVMFRHMLPSTTSHLIASLTLSIPVVILTETALSWLGIGLLPPVVSWGSLMFDAQSVRVFDTAPWLLLPGAAVVIAVLALNFVGDGLRDAADPYR